MSLIQKINQGVRWRLGLRAAALELELGTDESITKFYERRITDCNFLLDPKHYEYPRVSWILEHVRSKGRLLEIGCGNGGMTQLIAPNVAHLVALDISLRSLIQVRALGLENVETVHVLIEQYQPVGLFDCIVMSEVLEHLRQPRSVLLRCFKWLAPGGALLVTTPNGHWESNEHLNEYSFASFTKLYCDIGFESISVGYLRDNQERRRWLLCKALKADHPPSPDNFISRRQTRLLRSHIL